MVFVDVPPAFLERANYLVLEGKVVYSPSIDRNGTLLTLSSREWTRNRRVQFGDPCSIIERGDEVTALVPLSYTTPRGTRLFVELFTAVPYAEGLIVARNGRTIEMLTGPAYTPLFLPGIIGPEMEV